MCSMWNRRLHYTIPTKRRSTQLCKLQQLLITASNKSSVSSTILVTFYTIYLNRKCSPRNILLHKQNPTTKRCHKWVRQTSKQRDQRVDQHLIHSKLFQFILPHKWKPAKTLTDELIFSAHYCQRGVAELFQRECLISRVGHASMCMYICICAYICVCVCVFVCVCVCLCVVVPARQYIHQPHITLKS